MSKFFCCDCYSLSNGPPGPHEGMTVKLLFINIELGLNAINWHKKSCYLWQYSNKLGYWLISENQEIASEFWDQWILIKIISFAQLSTSKGVCWFEFLINFEFSFIFPYICVGSAINFLVMNENLFLLSRDYFY